MSTCPTCFKTILIRRISCRRKVYKIIINTICQKRKVRSPTWQTLIKCAYQNKESLKCKNENSHIATICKKTIYDEKKAQNYHYESFYPGDFSKKKVQVFRRHAAFFFQKKLIHMRGFFFPHKLVKSIFQNTAHQKPCIDRIKNNKYLIINQKIHHRCDQCGDHSRGQLYPFTVEKGLARASRTYGCFLHHILPCIFIHSLYKISSYYQRIS